MTGSLQSGWIAQVLGALDRDGVAVTAPGASWPAARLAREVAAHALWLADTRMPAGVPVPALLHATPQALALVVAGAATGRPVAPLGARLTVAELTRIVQPLPGDALLCDPAHAGPAAALAAATGRRVVVVPEVPANVEPGAVARLAAGLPAALAASDGIVLVLHTSGTTGTPRRVDVADGRLAARARHNAALLGLGPRARYATASPLHHIAGVGMMAVALECGTPLVLTSRFSSDVWCREWVPAGVTHALLVPSMVVGLLADGVLAAPQLEVLQYGAAPMPVAVLRAAMRVLPRARFVQFFGQTEGSPVTCLTAQDHRLAAQGREALLRTVGRAAPGVELRIEDPDADGVGEVVARGAHLFRVDPDGWLRTGDLGRLDGAGYLELAGRRGDKIIRGGENVYPIEVEDVLTTHPAVLEAAVAGEPDERLGEVVHAYVVLRPGLAAPPLELAGFVRSRLAGFKVPAAWTFLDRLPRNATGKVVRHELPASRAWDRA
jgi:acyl-CoA synthetase (AMP-forming)/AMP-acid ligase II